MAVTTNYTAFVNSVVSGTWTLGVDGTTAWKPDDGTNPSQREIDDMYALQQRIDAGEEVVIPEKKKEPDYNSQIVYGTGTVTFSNTTYSSLQTMVNTAVSGAVAISTNPAQTNAKDKYTGKIMKYIKGKHGKLHGN